MTSELEMLYEFFFNLDIKKKKVRQLEEWVVSLGSVLVTCFNWLDLSGREGEIKNRGESGSDISDKVRIKRI